MPTTTATTADVDVDAADAEARCQEGDTEGNDEPCTSEGCDCSVASGVGEAALLLGIVVLRVVIGRRRRSLA